MRDSGNIAGQVFHERTNIGMSIPESDSCAGKPSQGATAGLVKLRNISQVENRLPIFQSASHLSPTFGEQGYGFAGEVSFQPHLYGSWFVENQDSQHD